MVLYRFKNLLASQQDTAPPTGEDPTFRDL